MAKGIKTTPGKRKRFLKSPRVYITEVGRERIERVRKELGLTQFLLLAKLSGKTHGYKITQVDISEWFNSKKPMPVMFCKPLYEALDRDERIDFLQNYSPDENEGQWIDYLVREKSNVINFDISNGVQRFVGNALDQHKKREQTRVMDDERKVLRPLYSQIVEVYCGLSDSERKEICGELEQLVQKYKGD